MFLVFLLQLFSMEFEEENILGNIISHCDLLTSRSAHAIPVHLLQIMIKATHAIYIEHYGVCFLRELCTCQIYCLTHTENVNTRNNGQTIPSFIDLLGAKYVF